MTETAKAPRVMITGAAGGLGRVLCERFVATAALVHVCDVDAAGLGTLAASSSNVRYSVADVARQSDVDAMIGAALDCTPAAARAHVYQALKKLRAWLAQDEALTPAEPAETR